VLRFLPTQLSLRHISAELYVSLNTVKTHCSAIYRKLGVGDRRSAVQTARELGLL
jgi:LuxR family maltose regulon positive regulatory protein